MCSLFGFVARENEKLDLDTLSDIIETNVGRGPHAFGFAWIDERDRLRMFKMTGRMTDHLGALAMARNAKILIGHLRWATHGTPEDNTNNHPHPADGGWLVHNGVVHNYDRLVLENRFRPVSSCDSEVLGLLVEDLDGPLLTRCIDAAEACTGNLAMLGLWARPNTLIAVRRGNPLNCSFVPEGMYLATVPSALPGKVSAFKDNSARRFTFSAKGKRLVKIRKIAADRSRLESRNRKSLFEQEEYEGG